MVTSQKHPIKIDQRSVALTCLYDAKVTDYSQNFRVYFRNEVLLFEVYELIDLSPTLFNYVFYPRSKIVLLSFYGLLISTRGRHVD